MLLTMFIPSEQLLTQVEPKRYLPVMQERQMESEEQVAQGERQAIHWLMLG